MGVTEPETVLGHRLSNRAKSKCDASVKRSVHESWLIGMYRERSSQWARRAARLLHGLAGVGDGSPHPCPGALRANSGGQRATGVAVALQAVFWLVCTLEVIEVQSFSIKTQTSMRSWLPPLRSCRSRVEQELPSLVHAPWGATTMAHGAGAEAIAMIWGASTSSIKTYGIGLAAGAVDTCPAPPTTAALALALPGVAIAPARPLFPQSFVLRLLSR